MLVQERCPVGWRRLVPPAARPTTIVAEVGRQHVARMTGCPAHGVPPPTGWRRAPAGRTAIRTTRCRFPICSGHGASTGRARRPRGRRPRGHDHQPRERSTSPRPASPSSTSCATTSPSPRARCAARAAGRTCWCATPTASTASSSTRSARPRVRPDWVEVVALRFPSGRTAEEVVPRDAAALAWMANLGCLELHPHPVRAEDLDHPDELRVDLDPVPGVEWPQLAGRGAGRARGAGRPRPRRLAEDLGLARHPRQRADPPALVVRRGAARGARPGARGRAARARRSPPASGGRRSATASSSTTTRTPRTAPSPAPTRCGRSPTRASRRR